MPHTKQFMDVRLTIMEMNLNQQYANEKYLIYYTS
jgi:hypothetical protein